MATIKYFEDLEIWKSAQELAKMVYDLCITNEKIRQDFEFKNQIKKAALSISNNIAEGFEYNNNADFHRFLRIAKGSCGEVRNCLRFSVKINYTQQKDVNKEIELAISLGKQIGSLMIYLKAKILEKKLSAKQTRNSQPFNS
jgi:four helix bundle protein